MSADSVGPTAVSGEGHQDGLRGVVRPLSIAPMMQRTDRHYRYMMRLISRHTLLYTEMVTTGAILRGDRERYLAFDPAEHPIALQLGGDDPEALAESAKIGADYGYDEINLNVGCPSSRVSSGCFGASLMARPERVAEAVAAMRDAVPVPVTVKHRIGIDDLDRYEDMLHFVDVVTAAGSDRFSVHARKAWLKGLSPKENRNVPPLRYDDVYRLKAERPELVVEINGGVKTMSEVETHLERVDAVMIGRAAYDRPYLFADADAAVFGDVAPPPTRAEVIERMVDYAERSGDDVHRLYAITRHMLGLFAGRPGAKRWKQALAELTTPLDAPPRALLAALARLPEAALAA